MQALHTLRAEIFCIEIYKTLTAVAVVVLIAHITEVLLVANLQGNIWKGECWLLTALEHMDVLFVLLMVDYPFFRICLGIKVG